MELIMENKLREYLDSIFGPYSGHKQIKEIKEELYTDLSEKLEELRKNGFDEEKAYNLTVESIGNINELIEEITSKSRDLQMKIGFDFSLSDLKESDFNNINAIQGKFDYSNLVKSDFSESNLTGSSFKCSNLEKCNFDKTDLSNVNFNKSNLRGSTFENTKIIDTVFGYSDLSGITFQNMTINGANFNYAGLYNSKFINCTFYNVSFRTDLKKTLFKGCIMDKITFAMLKGYKAILEDITFI